MASAPDLAELRNLLRRCTVLITTADRSRGTGFFIDERHVLTCAHVVKENKNVFVQRYGREAQPAEVLEALPDPTDLALVRLEKVDDAEPPPAVILSRDAPSRPFSAFAAGFPKDDAAPGGMEVVDYDGDARTDPNDGRVMSYTLSKGNVTSGMSGGPLVDATTATVVALVRYTKDLKIEAGGGSIPVAHARERFDLVRKIMDEPTLASKEWSGLLGEDLRRALGLASPWTRRVDLWLAGERTRWMVGFDNPEHPVSVQDLGDGVAEVVFQWIQRGRVRSDSEVQLLGRLLSAALFPDKVRQRLLDLSRADEVSVRLHITGDALIDVSWELATVPGREVFLATEPRFRFARWVDRDIPVPEPDGPASILGIVVQNEEPEKAPIVFDRGKQQPWPTVATMANHLEAATTRGNLRPSLPILTNPQPSDVQEALVGRDTPLQIVHYIGYGSLQPGPMLLWSDGAGGLRELAANEFFGWVAESGARLLVMEFMMPPTDRELEPIPVSKLLDALQPPVCALVCTRVPLHAGQLWQFNDALYAALAGCSTIEVAVQRARDRLRVNNPIDDHAGFGWFTLITGRRGGLRLVSHRQQPGAAPLSEVPTAQPQEPAVESGRPSVDVFTR